MTAVIKAPRPEGKKVILRDVHHGTGVRAGYVYATLYEADTGELAISATLDYVLKAVRDRGYVLVKDSKPVSK